MSDFRREMQDELEVRGLEFKTGKAYIRSMEMFVEFFGGPAVEADVKDIKAYQRYLLKERKLSVNTINRYLSGIRFYFRHVHGRHWYSDTLPRLKEVRRAPVVLSQKEVAAMIHSVKKTFYKAVITLMYSSGLRSEELRSLKVTDIDSKRMVIQVRNGKGGRDRQALLSPYALNILRQYWRECRLGKPIESEWLFIPSKTNKGPSAKPLSPTAVSYMLKIAAKAAGIKKKYIPTY